MNRREFILGGAAAWPLLANAQPSSGRRQIGILNPTTASFSAPYLSALKKGLREFGYVENQDFELQARFGNGVVEMLPNLAVELATLKPAVIVAGSDPAVLGARKATGSIPIVMASLTGDPVALGLATSFARPGGNVTGITLSVVDASGNVGIAGKQIGFLKELRPNLTRIGFMFDPTDPIGAIFLKSIQKAAGTLNIECISLEVRDSDGFDAAFASGARRGMGALIIPPLPLFNTNRARIVERAAKAALPTIYGLREFVAAGGLCSYGANLSDVWRRSAYFVDKIFKGTRPGEIPIEQPTTFDLVLNTKTATAMGLIFPATLLARADEVIE